MSEAAFFAQSIIHWHERLDGFRELHGGGDAAAAGGEDMTRAEFEDLERRVEAEQQSKTAPKPASPRTR